MLKNIVLITLLIIALAAVGVLAYQQLAPSKEAETPKAKPGNGEPGMIKTQEAPTAPEFSEIDTSDWESYRSQKYGFVVQHPASWRIRELESTVQILGPVGNQGPQLINIKPVDSGFQPYFSATSCDPVERIIKIGGKDAKEYFCIYPQEDGIAAYITFPTPPPDFIYFSAEASTEPIIRQILSTLEFAR